MPIDLLELCYSHLIGETQSPSMRPDPIGKASCWGAVLHRIPAGWVSLELIIRRHPVLQLPKSFPQIRGACQDKKNTAASVPLFPPGCTQAKVRRIEQGLSQVIVCLCVEAFKINKQPQNSSTYTSGNYGFLAFAMHVCVLI